MIWELVGGPNRKILINNTIDLAPCESNASNFCGQLHLHAYTHTQT